MDLTFSLIFITIITFLTTWGALEWVFAKRNERKTRKAQANFWQRVNTDAESITIKNPNTK